MKRLAFALFSIILLSACSQSVPDSGEQPNLNMNGNPPISQSDEPPADVPNADLPYQLQKPVAGEMIAVVTTSKGAFKVRFFPNEAPETVKNFTELAKKGFYDGLIFHRVIPGFMIQGGDPEGVGTGGGTYNGEVLKDEFSNKLSHLRGALSMANRGPNTGTSQFFVVQGEQGATYLDGRHAIFGQVFDGMEVVDEIANTPRNPGNDKPLKDVVITKVEIVEMK